MHALFLTLPVLQNAVGRCSDQESDIKKPTNIIVDDDSDSELDDDDSDSELDDEYDAPNNTISCKKGHLESLVNLIETEYESRVGEIKEMIKNVSSKRYKQ